MADLISGLLAAAVGEFIVEWVSNEPITAAILFGLLALVFFFYLLLRRTVQGFKEGMQGSRDR